MIIMQFCLVDIGVYYTKSAECTRVSKEAVAVTDGQDLAVNEDRPAVFFVVCFIA